VDDEAALAPGDLLAGKYRVERVIGRGGMGVVLSAEHLVLRQRVAIKMLRGEVGAAAAARARFLREARAAASIQSEHAVRVYDVATTDDGRPYMVLEYLQGTNLDALIEEKGRLSIADACEYVVQACSAVAAAHALGIVHRDLKPSNLFLAERPDGSARVVVLDFGISKTPPSADEPHTTLTAPNAVLGTPQYMAPEQVRSSSAADRRSDVWALGVVLYELLAGAPPFVGESMPHLYTLIATAAHAPLRELRPEVPEEVVSIVDRCLAKDPEQRIQDVETLARLLAPHAYPRRASSPVPRVVATGRDIPTAAGVEVARRPASSRRLLASVALVAFVLGAGGAIAKVTAARRLPASMAARGVPAIHLVLPPPPASSSAALPAATTGPSASSKTRPPAPPRPRDLSGIKLIE
jgi:serine/threonine-protein kinase